MKTLQQDGGGDIVYRRDKKHEKKRKTRLFKN